MLKIKTAILAGVLATSTLAFATTQSFETPNFLPNDSQYSPFVYPIKYLGQTGESNNFYLTMYCINTNYFSYLSPSKGIVVNRKANLNASTDVAQNSLSLINQAHPANVEIYYNVGQVTPSQLKGYFTSGASVIAQKGEATKQFAPLATHTKLFQADNGSNLYFTVCGSVNLQTVGMTCKGNNDLRFVETTPVLYDDFQGLTQAIVASDGTGKFPGGEGTTNSSGTNLPPVNIGNYQVKFYAGRGNEFVGGDQASESKKWPLYINPPMTGEHAPGTVSWYDQVIYDAATQLEEGHNVTLYVADFEVGDNSSFVNNIWRFAQNGFQDKKSVDRNSNSKVKNQYMGNLTVYFLWQYYKGDKHLSENVGHRTYKNLYGNPIVSVSGSNGSHYQIYSAQIWPVNSPNGPITPQDMHNKFVIMDVSDNPTARELFVTSSNLDQPGKAGGGVLWQEGTIISAPSGAWSGANTNAPSLFNAYLNYYKMLWNTRQGSSTPGQINFFKMIAPLQLQGKINWIETVPNAPYNSSSPVQPVSGIDSFFYPIPISTTAEI